MRHELSSSPPFFSPPALLWAVVVAMLWLIPPSYLPDAPRIGLTLWMTTVCGLRVWGVLVAQKRRALEHRRSHRFCLHCGYELRESPSGCPKCGRAARADGRAPAPPPAPQAHVTPWWRRVIGAPPPTAAQKILFGKGLILAPAGAPFAVVKRGRVFVGKNGSVKQVEGARAWLPCACACGGRAVRYCARCGREQPARRGGS